MKSNETASVVTERKSIQVAFIAGVLSFLISLLFFFNQTPPLFGRYSSGLTAAFLAAITTFTLFIVKWQMPRLKKQKVKIVAAEKATYWVKRGAVAFVHASLVFLLLSATFFLLQNAFKGLELNAIVSALIVALSVMSISYFLYPLIEKLTLSNLAVILAIYLGVGVLTSAMSMQDPTWWQFHFSSLGAGNPVSAFAFNVTLIVAGLVVVAITELISEDLKKVAIRKGVTTTGVDAVRTLLVITGTALACVGLFVYDEHLAIHNIAASGMALMFIVLMSRLRKLVPFFDTSFYQASYSMLIGVLTAAGLFIFGHINLTALELVCAGVIFSWFIVFIRQIATMQLKS